MKPLHRVARWIDFFVSLVAAVYIFTVILVMAEGVDRFWPQVIKFQTTRAPVVWAGLALVVLLLLGAVLRAVQHVSGGAGGRYLEFDTPNGKVRVRVGSVEQVLDRTVRAMGEVADAAATLDMPKRALLPSAVNVRCRLFNRPNLLAIQDQVRAAVRQCYCEMFPTEEPLPVQVTVERIVFDAGPPKAMPKPAPDLDESAEESEPMRPQYPVDEA